MKNIIVVLIFVVSLHSCYEQPMSFYPVYDDELDTIFSKELLGEWNYLDNGDSLRFIVSKNTNGGSAYKVEIFYKSIHSEKNEFIAHLLQIDSLYYIDLFYNEKIDSNAIVSNSLLKVHNFYKISILNNKLKVYTFDNSIFKNLVKSDNITFIERDMDILLISSTEEIKDFISKHVNPNRSLIADSLLLKRIY